MFKTVRFSCQPFPALMLVVLLVLASFLAVHFLAENLVSLPNQPDSASNTGIIEELMHQDDLVLSVILPALTSLSQPWHVFQVTLPAQVQACFPFFQPPKI